MLGSEKAFEDHLRSLLFLPRGLVLRQDKSGKGEYSAERLTGCHLLSFREGSRYFCETTINDNSKAYFAEFGLFPLVGGA